MILLITGVACLYVCVCDAHTVCVTLCVHLWENLLSENPAPTLLAWQPLTTPSVTRLHSASYLVRFPDSLADASGFFKVRRGPCQFHILISKDPRSNKQVQLKLISDINSCHTILGYLGLSKFERIALPPYWFAWISGWALVGPSRPRAKLKLLDHVQSTSKDTVWF